jgi:hypothetical protein
LEEKMKKFALIVILILFVSLFSGADIYTKGVERMKAFELMGKKQQETLQMKDRWYGKNKYAEIGKDFTTIIDLEKEKMYLALHEPKIYFEVPADLDGNKLLEFITSLSPKVAEVIKSMRITDVKVNLDSESKKIANWECTASEFEMIIMIPAMNMMPKFKMKMWMTDELPKEYEKFSEMGEVFIQSMMGMLNIDDNSQKEMAKMENVDGFQIAADVTIEIFGTKIVVEAQTLEVSEKPAPPGIYAVPTGYTKKDIDFIKEKIKQIPKGDTPK